MGEGQDFAGHPSRTRVSVQQAAEDLGTTVDAIRKRVQRGTIAYEKDPDGRVWILLDADRTRHASDQDTTGHRQDSEPGALISEMRGRIEDLREQLEAERQAHAEARRLLMAALERIPPQLEAPSEARESPEKEASPGPADTPTEVAGEAQEGTERPQQRSGWLAPVDKLPWWHYVVGIIAVFLATFLTLVLVNWLIDIIDTTELPFDIFRLILLVQAWSLPGVFGFWVGLRRKNPRLVSQVIPLGALAGLSTALGSLLYDLILLSVPLPISVSFYGAALLMFLPGWLLYISGALIGNAWQRRRTGRISGTTPASPVSRTTPSAGQQPRKDLTPAKQAILGWGGTIISALITLVGTIITVRSGG